MSKEFRKLIRNRTTINEKLNSLEKYVNSIKGKIITPDIYDVQLRYDNNVGLLQDFEDIQKLIEENCEDKDLNMQLAEREPFESKYYKLISFFKGYLTENIPSTPDSNSFNNKSLVQDSLQHFLLPKIKLPIFNGDYNQWIEFKKSFLSTIGSNTTLNDNQKYNFLKAALEGYARRTISGCDESQNYIQAWQLLCDKFDKKNFLVDTHLKSIVNIVPINKSTFFQFRTMLDDLSKHLSALDGMQLSKDVLWDLMLIHIIYNKLDKFTQNKWKEFRPENELPNLEEFLNFLKERQDILESLEETYSKSNSHFQGKTFRESQSRAQINVFTNKIKCNFCKNNHTIYTCQNFLKLGIDERWEKVRALKLCTNCLRLGHSKETCTSGSCRKCRSKHNSLLHHDNSISSEMKNDKTSISGKSSENISSFIENENYSNHSNVLFQANNLSATPKICSTSILLSTVTFNVKDKNGNFRLCRALLDSGAQSNLVTASFCKRIGAALSPANLSIVGINQVVSTLNHKASFTIFSNFNNFKCDLTCYLVPTISSPIPMEKINVSAIDIPENISLSDPHFFVPNDIDMLIGVGLFWDLLLDGRIKLGKGNPTLQNTKLGWIVCGTISNNIQNSICNFSRNTITEDLQLTKFWEINEITNEQLKMSNDDLLCEKLFTKDTIRNKQGQFIVKLPLKYSISLLGNSKEKAIKRFINLEKRFQSDIEFHKLYKEFIHEYIQLKHMTKVDNETFPNFYLPHHGVYKESSLTTKLRVVFDASCASDSGWSLNDLQYVGPKVQNDIFDILIRFRFYKYVVSADISKMYRQVILNEEHRSLQQIIWRDNPNEEMSIYQLNTVTYGTKAASYLAIRCINQLALDYKSQYPLASQTITHDFYVDDLLTGSDDIDELKDRCLAIFNILQSGTFILRKWNSNCREILHEFEVSDISNSVLSLGESEGSKTLGVQWLVDQDLLMYKIESFSISASITKRQILSIISQIYDPLGLLSPVVIIAKIMIQKLWSINLAWDDSIPENLYFQWTLFYNQLTKLNTIKIPRRLLNDDFSMTDLHCFCDASTSAYASCIYLRSVSSSGSYCVRLLCSKAKVSPLKSLTIPRLELCAALLGAKLVQSIIKAYTSSIFSIPIYYWSDSKIVLCWLKKQPNELQTFVSNRVLQIQGISQIDNWHYVKTKHNPADLATRGIMPENMSHSSLWWDGPEFLYSAIDLQLNVQSISDMALPELKGTTKVFKVESLEPFFLFSRFSNINKLKRVTSWCLRFISNTRRKQVNKILGPLTVSELDAANLALLKRAQLESFHEEIILLRSNKPLSNKHKFCSLAPFFDKDGLLRVGGRLKFTSLNQNKRCPILLSSKHILTKLIFSHKHRSLLHPGPQLLLASIRHFYWPIGGRNLARITTKQCMTCFKFNPVFAKYSMASLPDERVHTSLPFQHTGIDYAGPFPIKDKIGRGSKILNCYLCLFICFCTKAIHLEIVSNLTTENFLSCLKRFVSRRGFPSDIYSDNGTTFIGASNELKNLGQFLFLNQNKLIEYSTENNIRWHFIPPYCPNFGGLWESAVRSTKHHLKRMLFNRKFIYEELNSLVVQIEGILNSRPLYSQSNDPNDLEPLTPSHFLIGRPITMLPDQELVATPVNRLSRLQEIQQMYQQFWARFRKEYITQLHCQYKWKEPSTPIKVGELVLVKNSSLPPCKWPLGRILQLLPGKDSVSRLAEIKTSTRIIIRSVRQLCPLPCMSDLKQTFKKD